MKYGHEQGKNSVLSKATTVLRVSNRVGPHKETFSGSAEPSLDPSKGAETIKMANPRHNASVHC
jgi:hypothetical protein